MKSFWIMNKDRVICKVNIDGLNVELIQYSTDIVDRQFRSDSPSIEDVYDWIEDRCFPSSRDNKKEILDSLNLNLYEPLEIVKNTHGLLQDDYIWIKWEGEDIEYDDIKIRV